MKSDLPGVLDASGSVVIAVFSLLRCGSFALSLTDFDIYAIADPALWAGLQHHYIPTSETPLSGPRSAIAVLRGGRRFDVDSRSRVAMPCGSTVRSFARFKGVFRHRGCCAGRDRPCRGRRWSGAMLHKAWHGQSCVEPWDRADRWWAIRTGRAATSCSRLWKNLGHQHDISWRRAGDATANFTKRRRMKAQARRGSMDTSRCLCWPDHGDGWSVHGGLIPVMFAEPYV